MTATCARCLKKGTAADMIRSRFTGNRYCRDWLACDRRFHRRQRALARKERVA